MRFRLKGRRLFVMSIPKPILVLSASLFFGLSVVAEDLVSLIRQLDAKPYAEGNGLRIEIQQLFIEASASKVNPLDLEELEKCLIDQLPEVREAISRQWLIRILEWFGSDASVPLLANYLGDSDKETRDCARRALIANPSDEATRVLARALLRAEEAEKAKFIDAFVYRNDVRSVKVIETFLKSENAPLVEAAARALVRLGDVMTPEALVEAWSHAGDETKAVLERAILTAEIDAEGCRSLIDSGANSGIASAAFSALLNLDPEAAEALLRLFMDEPASPLRSKILRIAFRREDLQRFLISKLQTVSVPDQLLLLDAISELSLSRYEGAVLALLSGTDSEVEGKVLDTLAQIGGQASFEPLSDRLASGSNKAAERALSMLDLPELNQRLFTVLNTEEDAEKRVFAVRLLALRNADGAEELFRTMIAVEASSDALRKECMKALESLGELQSCTTLAGLLLQGDPLKRDAQRSLKRLCLNYGDPDRLWNEVFLPALGAASSDEIRQDLLAIADAVAGDALMDYLKKLLEDRSSTLRSAAIKVLSRWPTMDSGALWIQIATATNASASDIKAAQTGLARIVKNNEIEGWEKLKLDMIVDALEEAPTDAFKQAMVACYLDPSPYIQHYLHDAFETYVDDPLIGSQVQKVLAKVPDSKERRKR